MRINPKPVDNSVNNPREDLFSIVTNAVGKFFLIIIASYIVIGSLTDFLVRSYPEKAELALSAVGVEGKIVKGLGEVVTDPPARLSTLFDQLVTEAGLTQGSLKLIVVKNDRSNALALPGKKIVVLSGLLKEIKSENELAMVLAHEIAHQKNHDIVRAVARETMFIVFLQTALGDLSALDSLLGQPITLTQLSYSREHETRADEFALHLLNKHYGHVGGAPDFFQRLKKTEKEDAPAWFFSTHPMSEDRVARLNELAASHSYRSGETVRWDYGSQ